jgi:hypothetical protein
MINYVLFSGMVDVVETRCWKLFSRCPLTKKRMFGRKCSKVEYHDFDRKFVFYVDTDHYAYELTIREPFSDIPLPSAFQIIGRVGPRPGY